MVVSSEGSGWLLAFLPPLKTNSPGKIPLINIPIIPVTDIAFWNLPGLVARMNQRSSRINPIKAPRKR